MNGYKMEKKTSGSTYLPPSNVGDPPASVDWRPKGYVTGIKNQVGKVSHDRNCYNSVI